MLRSSVPPRRWVRALAVLVVSCVASCRLVQSAAQAPGKVTSAMSGSKKQEPRVPPSVVQTEVMRYADLYAAQITQAAMEFAKRGGTPEARIQALTWIVAQSTAAYTIASGENANTNLLDMIVLASLGRRAHEQHWLPNAWGEADRPMLDAYTKLEEDIWLIARGVLTPMQQEQVRVTLEEWCERNPGVAATAFVRLPAFQEMLKSHPSGATNLFEDVTGLLSLDPLSGLEPATRQVELARQFAERTMYYAQRMPAVFSAQVELLALRLTRFDEVRAALADTERVSKAAADIASTAASLPEAVRIEREAAIKQISEELTAQREGLVADLERAQQPTSEMLAEARETLAAGTQMSVALQGTLASLDAFVGRFDKPAEANAPPAPPQEPGKPFDVSDYGAAAERVGVAAHELSGLVATLDQSLPQVRTLIDEAAQRGDRTVDHAFQRGLTLGLSLIIAAALAVLAVRWISARWFGRAAGI